MNLIKIKCYISENISDIMSYNEILNLDVGGTKFKTSRQTLMREPGSLLGRMFDIDSPLQPAAMQDGAYFLDRDPEKFKVILNYLREDELAELTKTDLINLKIEARYFQLTKLQAEIKSRLDKIDVYKFRYKEECYTVAKSNFCDIPFSAIVNFLEKGLNAEHAFHSLEDMVKPASDDDTIYLEAEQEDPLDCQNYILAARHHLVFHQKYMLAKATYINFNICQWVFKVRSEFAFKDSESSFYKCLKESDPSIHVCYNFILDKDLNYIPLSICICGEENCDSNNSPVRPFFSDKEKIMDSLEKLKSSNSIIDSLVPEDSRSIVDRTLSALGFLSQNKMLA